MADGYGSNVNVWEISYGSGRLGRYQTPMQYFGAGGLGSVRQICDVSGAVPESTR